MSIKGTTALFVSLSALSVAAVLAGACAINPQPLPPDTNDGSFGGVDAGSFGQTADGLDGAAVPNAGDTDAGAGGGSGGLDSGDASTDASTDAAITDAAHDGSD